MRFTNYIVAVGAATSVAKSVSVTRGYSGNWETLSPIDTAPRQEHSTVALSSSVIAILGGIIPAGDAFNTTSMMQFYDIPRDSWSSGPPLPIGANHPNVAAVDGKIYLLGGLAPAADGAWRAFGDCWMYDSESEAWTELPAMPEGAERGSAAMGVYRGSIFLAGGMRTLEPIGPGGEQDTVDTVSVFDTTTTSWTSVPQEASRIPEGRDHAGASVVGNKFYVLGGRFRGQYNVRDTVFVLDLDDLESGWRTSDGRMPTPRGGVAAGAINKRIYVLGGEGNPEEGAEGVFDQNEVFDTENEMWEQLGPMALPRHGGYAVAAAGGVYLPGGGIREGGSPVDVIDVFRP